MGGSKSRHEDGTECLGGFLIYNLKNESPEQSGLQWQSGWQMGEHVIAMSQDRIPGREQRKLGLKQSASVCANKGLKLDWSQVLLFTNWS